MKAVVVDPVAQRLEVSEVPEPSVGPDQLLVRVRAGALNGSDLMRLKGAHLDRVPGATAEPFIGGRELAGDVVAAGNAVTRWAPGDRVMGLGTGFAELAVLEASQALAIPAGMTWEEAGALPIALMTTHDAIVTSGRLSAGELVLIIGATSGVGVVAVQVASRMGARTVFATSRSADKLKVLESFLDGRSCPVVPVTVGTTDSPDPEISARVAVHTHDHGADVILDFVGGPSVDVALASAALTGRIVQIGRPAGRFVSLDTDELARKRVQLIGTTFRHRTTSELGEVARRAAADLGDDLGGVRPRIEAVFPLSEAAAAYAQLARMEHVGKLVLVQ